MNTTQPSRSSRDPVNFPRNGTDAEIWEFLPEAHDAAIAASPRPPPHVRRAAK